MKKQSLAFSFLIIISVFHSCKLIADNPEITKKELYAHIKFLASDSLKGRYPGTPEDKIAAQYIANEFNKAGLELLFNKGLQAFEVSNKLKLGHENSLRINNTDYEVNHDFIPISFSANESIEAEVIFAGYGFNIETENFKWNDYSEINVKDKWVLILRGEPTIEDKSIPFGMYSSLRSKATTAKDLGAAGVIFISGELFDKTDELIQLEKPEGNINIPVIQIKRNIANDILKKSGKSIHEMELKAKEISYNTTMSLLATTNIIDDIKTTYNIAAKLITNPNDTNYIVIGAHYDHLGFGGVGSGSRAPNEHKPHYGADDNASGVAAIIEIAERLANIKDSLKVNFIFVAFGAEEMGLLGSKYFTEHLPVNSSSISSMINIDMVGRMKADNSLQISGVGTSAESESILNDLNSKYNFKLGLSQEGYGPSDHSSFYSKNIPVFFFSTGAHIDYHTPADSLGNINFDGLKMTCDYIYDLAYDLSSNKMLLAFQESGPKMPNQSQGRTKLKVTLGIMPDFSGVIKNGLRADIVIDGKPAQKAGMKSGDIITAIDGNSVNDVYEYMERLSKLKPGQIITLEILREEQKEVLIVQL